MAQVDVKMDSEETEQKPETTDETSNISMSSTDTEATASVSDSSPEAETHSEKPEEQANEPSEEAAPEVEAPSAPIADTAETITDPEPTQSAESEKATEPEAEKPEAPAPPPVAAKVHVGGSEKHLGRTIFEVILVALVIGLGLWAYTLSSNNKDLNKQVTALNNNPQIVAQRQTDALLAKVGALMQLPTNETPTIANVSDAAKAKAQSAFFANAQNGDKVFMYVKAGQAILYRPSTNKIILVAPLTFNNAQATTPTAPAAKR